MEEFPEKQLIAFEKETIGFYFSRHPLAHYQEAIKSVTQEDTSTLSDRPNGAEVKICGLVSGIERDYDEKGGPDGLFDPGGHEGVRRGHPFPGGV